MRITNNFYINFYQINFVPKSLVNSLSLLGGFDINTINVFAHMKETSMSPRRMLTTFLPALVVRNHFNRWCLTGQCVDAHHHGARYSQQ